LLHVNNQTSQQENTPQDHAAFDPQKLKLTEHVAGCVLNDFTRDYIARYGANENVTADFTKKKLNADTVTIFQNPCLNCH
jgi:hypothetical protein